MKYDFDKVVPRRGTNSYKWDLVKQDDVIPLWVADMDFAVAPPIQEALRKRMEHPVFGYTLVPNSYYEAVINWFDRRHNWHIEKDWILYTSGVVPAVSCAIKAFTLPGEKVLLQTPAQTPAYNCFFSSIRNQGCEVLENELVREGDTYRIDFEDFERKCADEKTTVFLLCNPHNPCGRVWTKEELQRMADICRKHHVKVISDEIHCEIIMPGYHFTPFALVDQDNSVTLNSPSSTRLRRTSTSRVCRSPMSSARTTSGGGASTVSLIYMRYVTSIPLVSLPFRLPTTSAATGSTR